MELTGKLTGNLKKQVENEDTREGRKSLIEKAGMKLTDDELDKVAGGVAGGPPCKRRWTGVGADYGNPVMAGETAKTDK